MIKKTKVVCTIGPASESLKTLKEMVRAGMNVARLNFSHGSHDNHAMLITRIRQISRQLETPLAIMQDLQGPKIRIAELKTPVTIIANREVVVGRDFKLDFDVSGSIKTGERILIEDGLMELRVVRKSGKLIRCVVVTGGVVQSHKGVNLPDSKVKFPVLTEKDIRDLKFGLQQDVDFVAVSFVRSKEDIFNIKRLIKKYNPKKFDPPKVVAKIEKPEGVKNFDSILKTVDAVMVARGDLGVEIADSEVPVVQKTIIRKCLQASKPVIVATQMLDSMIRNPKPTRAEVSDVANAVIDEADCVMLSGESAFGKYPLKSVQEMSKIIRAMEHSGFAKKYLETESKRISKQELMADSVCELSRIVQARVIVLLDDDTNLVEQVASYRPQAPVLVLVPKEKRLHQLALSWGTYPYLHKPCSSLEELTICAAQIAMQLGLAKQGQKIVVASQKFKGKLANFVQAIATK